MKQRFRLYRRNGGTFYCHDSETGKQESLGTKNKSEAIILMGAKNESFRQRALNLRIAQTYLAATDPEVSKRTWQTPMDAMINTKTGETKERYFRAMQDKAFDSIRKLPILETRAEHFLAVLEKGSVATNVFLRRIHNFALDMNWLPWPVVVKKRWPNVEFKEKRAITQQEHLAIIGMEWNPERKAFYELLWHLGGSQSDVAFLCAEDIDWEQRVISYRRKKTAELAFIHLSSAVETILKSLPTVGALFPHQCSMHEKHRAAEFKRRCRRLGIEGITLHSYRYAWAERAKQCGYPERFAQIALGHNSQAVHRAYARKAQVKLPALDEYEKRIQGQNVIRMHSHPTASVEPPEKSMASS
jgi:integrase